MYNTDNYEPDTPQQMQYAELFQTGTLSLISTLPPGTGVFSPTCLVHCLSGQTPFSLLQVDVRCRGPLPAAPRRACFPRPWAAASLAPARSALSPQGITMSQALSSWYFNNQVRSSCLDCAAARLSFGAGLHHTRGRRRFPCP